MDLDLDTTNARSEEELLETVDIHVSSVVEEALLIIGETLSTAFMESTRYDEAMILNELTGAFSYAAECYGEKTGRIRQDLGVSLAEATLMKLEAFRRNNLESPSDDEWLHFAEDAKHTIAQERKRL